MEFSTHTLQRPIHASETLYLPRASELIASGYFPPSQWPDFKTRLNAITETSVIEIPAKGPEPVPGEPIEERRINPDRHPPSMRAAAVLKGYKCRSKLKPAPLFLPFC